MSLGIGKVDAEVYLHLATNGPKKGRELSKELDMYKQKLYRSLKNLQKKGLVKASPEYPATFTAITVEDLLDTFREIKLEEAQFMKEKKDELLARWQSLLKNDSET
jgi:sugar-specific transcriptional regulator TrmB